MDNPLEDRFVQRELRAQYREGLHTGFWAGMGVMGIVVMIIVWIAL